MAFSKISVGFDADTRGLVAGAKSASRAMDALGLDVKALKSRMNTLIGINAAQLFGQITTGVSYAVASFRDLAGSAAETVDQLSKFAQRTGVMYADMAGFALAAELAGVSSESLANAMSKADRAFVEAQRGSAAAADAFQRIGLSINDLAGVDAAGRFEAIAAAIGALPTEAEQAAAAMALFGRSGAELLPLFQQGAEGISAAREQAERLGLALTNEQGRAVEQMNDSWTLVRKSIDGIVQQVVANLAPAIAGLNQMWTDFVEATGGQNIGEYIADALFSAGEYLAGVADYLWANLSSVWEYASQVGSQWSSVWQVGTQFAGAMQAITGLWNSVFGGFLAGITIALEATVNALRNVISYIPGVDASFVDSQLAGIKAFKESIYSSIDASLVQAQEGFRAAVEGVGEQSGQAMAGPVRQALDAFRAQMNANRQAAAVEPTLKVDTTQISDAFLKFAEAVDVRSKEGQKELLRLTYGTPGAVSEEVKELRRQTGVLDNIEKKISEPSEILMAVV